MSQVQIEVNGVMVDLRDKDALIETIAGMTEDYATALKSGKIKTNQGKKKEQATISFFGSINHYLKGGSGV